MTATEFWDRYTALGEDAEEPGIPVAEMIQRLEDLARDLRETGFEPDV